MHAITQTLFVGNLKEAQSPPPFIGGVLFLAEEYDIAPPKLRVYAKIPFKEFAEADPLNMKKSIEWIEKHNKIKLLVCCRAGMGRSVSAVIAYLCCVEGRDFQDALLLAKARRPGAAPLPDLEKTIQQVQVLRQPANES